MAMTPQQATGTGKFFGAILLIMAAFALAIAVLTREPIMLVAGLGFAVGAIIAGLLLGLVTAPLLWVLSRLRSKRKHGEKS